MEKLEENNRVRAGFLAARNITKKYAKTFYLASLFLPREKRNASYVLYSICRLSDESVDASGDAQKLQRLEALRHDIKSAYEGRASLHPLFMTFQRTIIKYALPQQYFDELLAGMSMDLVKNRYATFDELYEYCYKVAGVIGLIMIQVFGYTDEQAKARAIQLGIAMQLTNILRDIQEDYARGRVYLPADEMEAFGINETHLAQKAVNENVKRFLQFQIARARTYYASALQGVGFINNRNSRMVILAMADMYSGILDKIEENNYDVFSWRAHLCLGEKAARLAKILMKGAYL